MDPIPAVPSLTRALRIIFSREALTVWVVRLGNSLRRPTLQLSFVLTRKHSIVVGQNTVSQFTADETRLGNTSHTRNLED